MATSLRSRLWLSYFLLLLVALILSALFLVIYLPRSPLAYRQTYLRLETVQETLLDSHPNLSELEPSQQLQVLQSADTTYKVRFLIYSSNRALILDSRAGSSDSPINFRRLVLLRTNTVLYDDKGTAWLFHIYRLGSGNFLLTGILRPRIGLVALLTGELLPPFIISGLVALVLSLLVALGFARWIGAPIERLVAATRKPPNLPVTPVPATGPKEIQALTNSFNAMTLRSQAAQKSQRDFVANISHELKTPLTSIQGFAQALQDGTANSPEQRRQAAGVIQDETERMNRMVLDLLDLARLDAGTLEMEHLPVDLAALLSNVAEKFTHQATAANVTIQVNAFGVHSIIGDGDKLAQVFSNLVDNALKFSPRNGIIKLNAINVLSPQLGVQVDVADKGEGIPSESLPKIFDRFYQVDPSRSRGNGHGTGLGLAIVKEIVNAHGGSVTVQSIVGKGSTFSVFLPETRNKTENKQK